MLVEIRHAPCRIKQIRESLTSACEKGPWQQTKNWLGVLCLVANAKFVMWWVGVCEETSNCYISSALARRVKIWSRYVALQRQVIVPGISCFATKIVMWCAGACENIEFVTFPLAFARRLRSVWCQHQAIVPGISCFVAKLCGAGYSERYRIGYIFISACGTGKIRVMSTTSRSAWHLLFCREIVMWCIPGIAICYIFISACEKGKI